MSLMRDPAAGARKMTGAGRGPKITGLTSGTTPYPIDTAVNEASTLIVSVVLKTDRGIPSSAKRKL